VRLLENSHENARAPFERQGGKPIKAADASIPGFETARGRAVSLPPPLQPFDVWPKTACARKGKAAGGYRRRAPSRLAHREPDSEPATNGYRPLAPCSSRGEMRRPPIRLCAAAILVKWSRMCDLREIRRHGKARQVVAPLLPGSKPVVEAKFTDRFT